MLEAEHSGDIDKVKEDAYALWCSWVGSPKERINKIVEMGWACHRDAKEPPMSGTALDVAMQITVNTLVETRKQAEGRPGLLSNFDRVIAFIQADQALKEHMANFGRRPNIAKGP